MRVARSGEDKKWKRRVAENAELIPLVVLCGESKGAHHVDGTNNDRTITVMLRVDYRRWRKQPVWHPTRGVAPGYIDHRPWRTNPWPKAIDNIDRGIAPEI
ncbi:MAG: hypothetical protein ACK5T6_16925 [Pirellula sp.]